MSDGDDEECVSVSEWDGDAVQVGWLNICAMRLVMKYMSYKLWNQIGRICVDMLWFSLFPSWSKL